MNSAYDGRAVANFVLDYCDSKDRQITHLDLQKIVYFCHVWSLITLKRPLVRHKFEAWEFGPVLPYLYREFKRSQNSPIHSRAKEINPASGVKQPVRYDFDAHLISFLSNIVEFYSRIRTSDLVEMSHVEDGPWYQVWNHDGAANPGMRISDESIFEFYSHKPRPFTMQ